MEINEKVVQRWRDDALVQIAVRNKCIAWVCVACLAFFVLFLMCIIASAISEPAFEDAVGPVILLVLVVGGVLLGGVIDLFKKQRILDNEIQRRNVNEGDKEVIHAARTTERQMMKRKAAYIVAAAVAIIVVGTIIALGVSSSEGSKNEPWEDYGMSPGEYYEKVWDYNDD